MSWRKTKMNTNNHSRQMTPWTVVLGWVMVSLLNGCGDFLATKPTEVESKVLLDELSQVRESLYIQNPLPEVYRQPPVRVTVAGGVKLFYFTRQHPVKQLAELVQQQFDIKVIQNPSTNQLVLFCADAMQADQVLQYLEKVDVPPVQVNIDCLILERFGDITMDWETSILAQNLFGEEVTVGEKRGDIPASRGRLQRLSIGTIIGVRACLPGRFPAGAGPRQHGHGFRLLD
jgi:hypothetical protein